MFRRLASSSAFRRTSSLVSHQQRFYAPIVKVPEMGDSISEGTVLRFLGAPGDVLAADSIICQIETAKITADVRMPETGKIVKLFAGEQEDVAVGQELFEYEATTDAPSTKKSESPKAEKPATETAKPAASSSAKPVEKAKPAPSATPSVPQVALQESRSGDGETRVKMTRMRKAIAERLKESQNTNALLTTFNEIDMSKVMKAREDHKDWFQKKYGIKMGFMGFFCKAAAIALKNNPSINAVIDGDDIVYRDYVDISIAVATPKGLVTPVIRNCESLSVAEIELEIARLAAKARDGKIELSDLQGGTFTISNGGVYGSMMGTPIVNPPQSAILGMHATKKRPVVITENGEDKIVIRPMMFTALTYDHRLIDGKGAVTFLKELGEVIASPELIGLN